jgi:hypothetical protein
MIPAGRARLPLASPPSVPALPPRRLGRLAAVAGPRPSGAPDGPAQRWHLVPNDAWPIRPRSCLSAHRSHASHLARRHHRKQGFPTGWQRLDLPRTSVEPDPHERGASADLPSRSRQANAPAGCCCTGCGRAAGSIPRARHRLRSAPTWSRLASSRPTGCPQSQQTQPSRSKTASRSTAPRLASHIRCSRMRFGRFSTSSGSCSYHEVRGG